MLTIPSSLSPLQPRCDATSGPRKGRSTWDDRSMVGGDWTMILQPVAGTFYKVGYISESDNHPRGVNFQYAKLGGA